MSQRPASDKKSAVRSFHKDIRHVALQGEQTGKVGKFGLANVDQIPLPFCFADGSIYATLVTKPFGFKGVEKRARSPCLLMARPELSCC